MTTIGRTKMARRVVLAALISAGVPAMSEGSLADPAAAPAPPLTVPVPDASDASARREANLARIRDARLEQLHAGLQLAPEQERLWPAVADAIRGFDVARGRRFRHELDAVPNSIDGLTLQGDHMAKVGVAMGQLAKATRPLVATLTPEQKARLSSLLQRAPLRKIVARAFGMPLEQDHGAGASPPAPAATAAPGKPAGESGAAPQQKDPDDDD